MTPTPASSGCVLPEQATHVSEFIQQLGATAEAGDDLDRRRATQAIGIVTSSPMPSRLCNPTEEAQTEVVQSDDNIMREVIKRTIVAMTQTAVAKETQIPQLQGFSPSINHVVYKGPQIDLSRSSHLNPTLSNPSARSYGGMPQGFMKGMR